MRSHECELPNARQLDGSQGRQLAQRFVSGCEANHLPLGDPGERMTVVRSRHAGRRGFNRGHPGVRALALLLISTLLVAVLPPSGSYAEGEAIPVGEFRLLEPVEDMLSASSWVMATARIPDFSIFRPAAAPERSIGLGTESFLAAPKVGPQWPPRYRSVQPLPRSAGTRS